MTRLIFRRLLAPSVVALVAFGCGDGSSRSTSSPTSPSANMPGSLVFTQSPVDPSAISSITPLGNLNPPGHTLPTNHIYLFHGTPGLPVVAPANGLVQVATRGADDALLVQAAAGASYSVGHIVLDAGIVPGMSLASAQRIGVTSTLSPALDLGVSNAGVALFFIRPE